MGKSAQQAAGWLPGGEHKHMTAHRPCGRQPQDCRGGAQKPSHTLPLPAAGRCRCLQASGANEPAAASALGCASRRSMCCGAEMHILSRTRVKAAHVAVQRCPWWPCASQPQTSRATANGASRRAAAEHADRKRLHDTTLGPHLGRQGRWPAAGRAAAWCGLAGPWSSMWRTRAARPRRALRPPRSCRRRCAGHEEPLKAHEQRSPPAVLADVEAAVAQAGITLIRARWAPASPLAEQ